MNYYKLNGEIGTNLLSRGGNRGGRALFSWDDVKAKRYVDRQVYLGVSSKVGVLDRGGVFRKRDWWTGNNDQNGKSFKAAKQQQKMRLQNAFSNNKGESKRQLSGDQIKELISKIKGQSDYQEERQQCQGLGFKNKEVVAKKQEPSRPKEKEKVKEEGRRDRKERERSRQIE